MTPHTPQPPAGDDLVARLRSGVAHDGEIETDDGVIELCDIEGANDLMDEAANAIAEARARIRELEDELNNQVRKLGDEISIVDRVWAALDVKTYEDAAGKEISELVREWKARADSAERQRDALRESLRQMSCPRPCNGRPDEFTAGQCIDAGECGCVAQVGRLSEAEGGK